MPSALVALLLAGELVATAPPAVPASTTAPAPTASASPPQGVVGVDLPAFPAPVRPQRLPPPPDGQPSQLPGFEFGDPFRQRTAPSASSDNEGPRCRRTETANGFTYACGEPEAARQRREEAEQLLNGLLSPP